MPNISSVTLGFIGFGNMAGAIVDGLLLKQVLPADRIFVCAKDPDKLAIKAGARGVIPCADARETAERADLVVIAVKPYLVPDVIAPIREILREKIVVSVAAGLPCAAYEPLLLPGTRHMSTLPNTPVAVGEGVFLCEKRHSLTDEDMALFEALFSPISLVRLVETPHLGIAGTISGCGPAFVSMFMEALGDAGVQHGLPRALAYELAAQMTAGTGRLLLRTGDHPGVMKDAVCSPGGTTIVGVAALERGGLRSAVIDAVDAIQHK